MTFFRDDDEAEDIYKAVRDKAWLSDAKEYIEAMWVRYQPICPDSKFTKKALNEFEACMWQMYLSCMLLNHGYTLEKPGPADPDVKIRQADGSVLWIEAVLAEAGEGINAAKRIYGQEGESGVYMISEEKQMLRYQNALRGKIKQRDKRIASGSIRPEEPYVVAVNAGGIDDADMHDGVPGIVRAVYPIGPMTFTYRVRLDYSDGNPDFDPQKKWVRPHTRAIKMPKGGDASTMCFMDGSMSGISALIFAPDTIVNAVRKKGREFITIYNHTASKAIPHDSFKLGQSWHPDGDQLIPTDWRSPREDDDER